MRAKLTEIERKSIAIEILPYVNGDYRELYQPKRASIFHKGKPWHAGAKAAQNLNEIKISELMQLPDNELEELKEKIDKAKAAKGVKTRQARYFLK